MIRFGLWTRSITVCLLVTAPVAADDLPPLSEISVTSSLDGSRQPSRTWIPKRASQRPTPLFVYLHSWSGDYRQDNSAWLKQAVARGWIFLHPNFRGRNDTPAACGSKLARADILDAIDWVADKYQVDPSRIYLAGSSGGGHMAMLMAGHHPRRFSAVSAWVGISDLGEWYRFHLKDGQPQNYARMILKSLGGPPGTSKPIDLQYRDRSPVSVLNRAADVPLDLCAGVHDGKTGSVPIHHTLKAWNIVARARKAKVISDSEMDQLWTAGRLKTPGQGENVKDNEFGRLIHLRRRSGPSRVTIFEGGHEGLSAPASAWLARQKRLTRR
ncbi:MAG TPA: prolyl oligopeptidase [Planctomycetaceae bacterium]|nr:prolyl oligopeptidase [Planctomycetaceae bacterium]HCD01428.1 prolyl oligopeptidase [Planctomycetaceae bacterium]